MRYKQISEQINQPVWSSCPVVSQKARLDLSRRIFCEDGSFSEAGPVLLKGRVYPDVAKVEDAAVFSIRFFEFRVSGKIFNRVKYLKGYSFNFAGM